MNTKKREHLLLFKKHIIKNRIFWILNSWSDEINNLKATTWALVNCKGHSSEHLIWLSAAKYVDLK